MRPRAALVEVGLPDVPVVGSPAQERRDLRLGRDDLLAQRVDEEALLLVLADLERAGRRVEQVLERLVVDLEVRRAQEELLLGVLQGFRGIS